MPKDNNFDNLNVSLDSVITNKNGINNSLNDCFMISTLQSLIHCPPFIRRLFSLEINSFRGITKEFYNLCRIQSIKKSNSLNNIKRALKYKKFCDNQQHDSMEFGRIFLEQINQELNIASGFEYREIDYKNKSKIEAYKEYKEMILRKENSIIIETFYFNIISTCKCESCGNISYSFQAYLDLTLSSLGKNKEENLVDLFNEFFKIINVEKKCVNCSKLLQQKKKFSDIPEILILSFQNADHNNEKNEKIIQFNERLNISKYIDDDLNDLNDLNNLNKSSYELFCIINHQGNMDSGHYYSYIKINKEWYEFNDGSVKRKESIETRSNKVYILYYKKIK